MKRLVLAALVFAAPVQAQEFEAVLGDWLAGDDATALPAMAALAEAGDADARLMLALIEHRYELGSAWTDALDREARIALYRQPGGLSGVSWIDALDGELAGLVRDLDRVDTPVASVLSLEEKGEARLARAGLRAMAKREQYGDARAVVAAEPMLAAVVAPLVPGIEAAADAPHPLVMAYCAATCPDVPVCAASVDARIGGWSLGSPTTSLISEADWVQSARGLASVERALALTGGLTCEAME